MLSKKSIIRRVLPLFLTALLILSCQSKDHPSPHLPTDQLKAAFLQYKESSITHRRFKHADIVPLIKSRGRDFQVEELGKSVQGREIYQLAYGKGKIKILFWSQMHGNESTATMALFDLFNFLDADQDDFDTLRSLIRNELSLRFIPMVNPDGVEIFQRRNALDIDINRDAIQETTPEATVLKAAREKFKPAFGFNLHDQQIYHNVKGSPRPATISVLAPAYNPKKEINEVRKKSMLLIAGMNRVLQQLIPGHVGRYSDEFEPRAFGDNFQKWGTSTVLIESGGYPDDNEKQYVRQINFMITLNALYEIATQNYAQYSTEQYSSIPDNDFKLMDLIVRKVSVENQGKKFEMDLGIKKLEVRQDSIYSVSGTLVDKGDLSVFFGYEEINAEGMLFKTGNIWKGTFASVDDISEKKAWDLLKQGYMCIMVKKEKKGSIHRLPLIVVKKENDFQSGPLLGQPANFFLEKEGKLRYAIINGYIIDLQNPGAYFPVQRIL